MPAEWNVTTLILRICALRSVQAKRKGSLPAASVRGNLQPGLLQSLFPCPRVVKEISPWSSDSILHPWRIGRAPLPLPLQLGKNACQRRSRADNSLSNIWNQTSLTTAAIIYYYTASVRGRPLRSGSRQYYPFQNKAPHTGFSPQFTQQWPSRCKANSVAAVAEWMPPSVPRCPLSNWLHCLDMKPDLLAILSCSLKFLVSSASIACPYAEMLPEYFTERYIPNMGNTTIKTDNMKQVETPESNRLHLLTIDYVMKYNSSNEKQGMQRRR